MISSMRFQHVVDELDISGSQLRLQMLHRPLIGNQRGCAGWRRTAR
jgi:hypothetical protein